MTHARNIEVCLRCTLYGMLFGWGMAAAVVGAGFYMWSQR